ncbi:MAG: hypothetical protein H6668_17640 [Ardenticatenaceae bacterium]|nr:hypothetical protein [Ardenticatenaceae bacterium]
MTIPTVFNWLARFGALRGEPAAYLLVLTAVFLLIAWDWRAGVAGLMVHYLLAWLLLADMLDPRLAAVKLVAGLFVCLIFYWTARQVQPQPKAVEQRLRLGRLWLPASLPRRLILTPLMLLLVLWLAQNPAYALPGVPDSLGHLTLAVYGLAGLGLLGMALTTDPWQAGLGLLLFLTGFDLFYTHLDHSVLVLALLAATQLLAAVAVAYLTQGQRAVAVAEAA